MLQTASWHKPPRQSPTPPCERPPVHSQHPGRTSLRLWWAPEPLPSDWLIGIHAFRISWAKAVGTVLLIKWPKTLAVSVSCECGASGVCGDSGWPQISSHVCRKNRWRVSSLLPSGLRWSPGVCVSARESTLTEDKWSQTANVLIHLHFLPIMDLLRTINKRKLLKVSKTINLLLHLWHERLSGSPVATTCPFAGACLVDECVCFACCCPAGVSGNMLEWCLPKDMDLDGVEFKAIASGSHRVTTDFMWVCTRPQPQLVRFDQTLVENKVEEEIK